MNKSVYIQLFNLQVSFKSKQTHYFMISITALFNQKHMLRVSAILLLIEFEAGQQRPLLIKLNPNAFCTCFHRLNTANIIIVNTKLCFKNESRC